MRDIDYFSYAGATTLKRKIEDFWAKRGHWPKVRIEKQYFGDEGDGLRSVFVVRSNIEFDERGFPDFARRVS